MNNRGEEMEAILASKNKHKLEEIEVIVKEFGIDLVPLDVAGYDHIDVVEDGETFEANSFKKAKTIADLSGKIVIADDSGLEVDFLDGAPGVYSARFAGEDSNDEKNNQKLLKDLEGVKEEKRDARFVCVITMIIPDQEPIVVRGECEGRIGFDKSGDSGFGYDPLFIVNGFNGKTFAELGSEVKNEVSHRAAALIKLKKELNNRF